jgi:multiple sugar transport system permease protein
LAETTSTTRTTQAEEQSRVRTHASARRRIQWSAYIFILPAFIIIGIFHIFPVFYAIYVSLNKGAINRFTYVGLAQYATALSNGDFWNSLITTFVYALLTMPVTMALALFFAYLLYQPFVRARGIFRAIYFLPYVVSTVGSAIVWAWIFDPRSGLANYILTRLGLPALGWLIEPDGVGLLIAQALHITIPVWLDGPSLALVGISIFSIWQFMGYDIVIFLAGLTTIPNEMYEAARIDGANGFQLFRHITIPLLAPTTFFVIVISVIGSLQSFNHIFAMNEASSQSLGGPLGSTSTLTVYMFDQLYTYSNYGYASAIAIILSLIILAFTLFNFKVLGQRSRY